MIIAIISIDVVDCFRKYLLDASVAYGFMFFIKMGIPLTSVSLLYIIFPEIMVSRMIVKTMRVY